MFLSKQDLTEAGMRQGVYDSDVVILFLTNSVLNRSFCQKEVGWALELDKPVIMVVEEEERFCPFDLRRWKQDRYVPQVHVRLVGNMEGCQVHQELCRAQGR